MAATVHKVQFSFSDKEGNASTLTVYLRFPASEANVLFFINDFKAKYATIGDGVITHVIVSHYTKLGKYTDAHPDADVQSRLLLFYRKEGIFESIAIPSPKQSLFETTGIYASIRLDALAPEIQDLIDPQSPFTTFIVTPEGESFPTEFIVGGLAL